MVRLAFALFVQVEDVRLLNVAAVQKHIGRKVAGSRCTPDVATKALLDEIGQLACMVDVGVAENNSVDAFQGEVQVAGVGIGPVALVEAAIEQNAFAVDLQQVHGAGNFLGRAVKCELHKDALLSEVD